MNSEAAVSNPEESIPVEDVIVRNSAVCLACGDHLESKYRHDFCSCSCGAVSVDGGHDYLRRIAVIGAEFKDTSIVAPDEPRTHLLEHTDVQVFNVHHSALCAGRPCTIHNRSDHRLRSWPQAWVNGRIMRQCEHGQFHKDPDEPGRKRCKKCDGCCKS